MMKKVLTGLVAVAAVMALATSAVAQSAGPKNGGQGGQQGRQGQGGQQFRMRGQMQEQILKKLNLTAAQKQKWDATTKQMRDDMMKTREAAQKSGKQPDRAQFTAKMKTWNDKLMAILTPKQKADYEKLMKEAVEKMRKERGAGGGAAGGTNKGGTNKGGKGGGGR
jgi:Spy/CpxP family protein refolding chaperone